MDQQQNPAKPDAELKGAVGPTPRFELPPELINSIIEMIIKKLIEAILGALQPGTPAPPIVVVPPVGPPVEVQPAPPTVPPRPVESYLIAGITTAYHSWFAGDSAQEVPAGQATPHQVELIRQGLLGLPPASRVQVSADPMPFGCIEFPFPAIEVEITDQETGEKDTVVLTKENPQPESWVIVQGGETPSSIYIRSTGHHFILVFDAPARRSSIKIVLRASNGAESNPFGMPWCIKGDGAGRSNAMASKAAAPFAYDEPQELQQKTL